MAIRKLQPDYIHSIVSPKPKARIYKRFLEGFQTEYTIFLTHINGINNNNDLNKYATLMLTRLMFLYFLQRKNFLDNDSNYLSNHLKMFQNSRDTPNLNFYHDFLLILFFEGLSNPILSSELSAIIGNVPFLNIDLFKKNQIESNYSSIQISDAAFEPVFTFFDTYSWQLSGHICHNEIYITPDIFGYIFEKRINQKQMGAFYTQDDITGFIAETTIIPFLFNTVEKKCPDNFQDDRTIWQLLRDNPDRYIYSAIQKGVEIPLPPEIEEGLHDVSRRNHWNRLASDIYALPAETWREVIARRQHFQEIHTKLESDTVRCIDELVSYNLDICLFALDVVEKCEDHDLVQAFYESISKLSVLDPTCGSGAFLFAVLDVLEPLYTVCLDRLEELNSTNSPGGDKPHTYTSDPGGASVAKCSGGASPCISPDCAAGTPCSLSDCVAVDAPASLARWIGASPRQEDRQYSILKSIITSNLYGVDIMEEATEICKLRLFLKLLAQIERPEEIEPLPNLDSNIRSGNTLLGSTNQLEDPKCSGGASPCISSDCATVDAPASLARWIGASPRQENQPCSFQYSSPHSLQEDQPFHWFVEFKTIMQNGGFDIIIGNPPYVESEKVSNFYKFTTFKTSVSGNLYALIMERCASLLVPGGRFGMIVPASATCTDGYLPLQQILLDQSSVYIASFSDQRGKLFDIPHPRLCIISYKKRPGLKRVFTTPYIKPEWHLRKYLFQKLAFIEVTEQVRTGIIPRYGSPIEQTLHAKIYSKSQHLGHYLCKKGTHKVFFTRKLSWFVQVTPFIPRIFDAQGRTRKPSELKTLLFLSSEIADIAFVALNSSLFYWFLTTGSDCRNLNMREVLGLPLNIEEMPLTIRKDLQKLADLLAEELQVHSEMRRMTFKATGTLTIQCVFPGKSKTMIDEIDRVLAQYYGFTDEELDFIINYDLKYRLGRS